MIQATEARLSWLIVMDDDGHAISYKVLRRGTPVRSADGVEVGTVRRAQETGREHIFDGIVIDTKAGRRFVDAPEVARMTNKRVILEIDSAAIAELEPYKGLLGRIGESTSRRAQRRANRLRRR